MEWTVPVFTKTALVFLGSSPSSETVWGWPPNHWIHPYSKRCLSLQTLTELWKSYFRNQDWNSNVFHIITTVFCPSDLLFYQLPWHTLCTLYCPSQVWTIVQNNSCIANYGLLHPNWKLSVIIQWTWIMTSLWIFIVAYLEMIYGRVLITAKKDTHLAFKLANGLLGHLGQKGSAWNLGLRLKLELSGKQLLFWHILQC